MLDEELFRRPLRAEGEYVSFSFGLQYGDPGDSPQRIVNSSPGLAVEFTTGFVMYTPASAEDASVSDAKTMVCRRLNMKVAMIV